MIYQRYLSSKTGTEVDFLLKLVAEMYPSEKYLIPGLYFNANHCTYILICTYKYVFKFTNVDLKG